MIKLTFRGSLFSYGLLFLILIWPYWAGEDVIAPHRNFSELSIVDQTGVKQIENRKFGDFSSSFIPETSEHLNGVRSGLLTLWVNKNELGRPAYHSAGFSPAYITAWLISKVTDNPWRFLTILSLSTSFLAGLFILLFAREIGLGALSGLIAGTVMATSPLIMYWLCK